jgi:hypothetical protein
MTKVLDAPLLLALLDSARDSVDPIVLGKDFVLPDAFFDEDGGAVVCDERCQVSMGHDGLAAFSHL